MTDSIQHAVAQLSTGPLREDELVAHLHPLFSRALRRQEIYLANHSLGRPLDRTADDLRSAIDLWYAEMDLAWDGWMERITTFRDGWAKLLGTTGNAVVPKTAAGQGLRAVLNSFDRVPNVVTTTGEFDSIDFILKTYARKQRAHVRYVPADDAGLFDADRIIEAIGGGGGGGDKNTGLVVVSLVIFATGQRLEGVERIIESAHERGAKVLLDSYHAAGAVPVNLETLNADFAIGGSYKYARGGPGACWLWINPRLLSNDPLPSLYTLDTGWFAKAGTMDFVRDDQPRLSTGGDAWLESTLPVLPFVQALAGLDLLNAIGVDRLCEYNTRQQQHLAHSLEAKGVGLALIEPRGAFLTALSDDPQRDTDRLREQGLVIDARRDATGKGLIRFCPDLLNTAHELDQAATIAGEVLGSGRS